ncbi:hypothetical protein AN478_01080 [Thiohalorhabdus denitrificans]|nr:hypothetical protein AN478_01080 [Thiohalorhabdus denitrificans]
MAMKPTDPWNRPVFLHLLRIRFPVGAWASILHRITGVILVAAVPATLALVAYSARSPANFQQVGGWLASGGAGVGIALVLGALAHHIFAGIRLLLMEAGLGEGLPVARSTAWASMVGAALVVVAALALFWIR